MCSIISENVFVNGHVSCDIIFGFHFCWNTIILQPNFLNNLRWFSTSTSILFSIIHTSAARRQDVVKNICVEVMKIASCDIKSHLRVCQIIPSCSWNETHGVMTTAIMIFLMMTSSNGNIIHVTGLCVGNSPVTDECPSQRPVTLRFGVFFDLRLNKWSSKQSKRRWSEMPTRSSWRHCNTDLKMSGPMFLPLPDSHGSLSSYRHKSADDDSPKYSHMGIVERFHLIQSTEKIIFVCEWIKSLTCKTVSTPDLAKYGIHKILFWCWMTNCLLERPLNTITSKCS